MNKQLLNSIEGAIMAKKPVITSEPVYFSTGVDILDLVVGAGETCGYGMGYLAGSIVRDWGDSSSSKTFKACQFIAANYYKYKDKLKWCIQDVEHGNTIDTMKLYGFDIFANSFKGPKEVRTVEDWFYDVTKFLESLKPDEYGVYILDSLDSLSSNATEDRKDKRIKAGDSGKELEGGTYGMDAQKFLSQEMFRGMQADLGKANALLYVISQARDNIGVMQGPALRVNGGKAIKFAESVRIQSKAMAKDADGGVPTSVQVIIRSEKTRHPKPFRTCQFPVIFDYGIDNTGASVDYLFDLRSDIGNLLKRADAISWGGGEPVTEESIEAFLDEQGVLDTCMHELKKKYNAIKNVKAWIEANDELKALFEERFGKTMSRDELIQYIEDNHLQKELKKRVIAKWDAFEDSIATKRPRQFSYIDE
jgi:hypothetical protein